MRRPTRLVPPIAVVALSLALLASGCGGSSTSGAAAPPAGASVAPASAAAFVTVDTDPGSAQWKQAEAILQRFPGRDRLLAAIQSALRGKGVDYEQDVKPALGDEVDVVVLGDHDAVAMTQPKDSAKLRALLAKADASGSGSKTVSGEYRGWTLVSDKQSALDTFEADAAKGAIADDANYKQALGAESGDALVRAYANGTALQSLATRSFSLGGTSCSPSGGAELRYVDGALSAQSDGVLLHATVASDSGSAGASGSSELASQIPSGALLVLDFHGAPSLGPGLDALQRCAGQSLGTIEGLLGVKLAEVGALFAKESALYVRSAAPIPEVTFVAQEDDPQKALATLDSLAQRLGGALGSQPEPTTVDGVAAKKLVVRSVTIYYAALDGEVVVSDSQGGIHDLRSGGSKLKDDPSFQRATKAAGMPDRTSGFLYADLADGIPLVESYAQLAGTTVPTDVDANLKPLQSLVVYGASDGGGKAELGAFLGVK